MIKEYVECGVADKYKEVDISINIKYRRFTTRSLCVGQDHRLGNGRKSLGKGLLGIRAISSINGIMWDKKVFQETKSEYMIPQIKAS